MGVDTHEIKIKIQNLIFEIYNLYESRFGDKPISENSSSQKKSKGFLK